MEQEALEYALKRIKLNLNLLMKYNRIDGKNIEDTLKRINISTDLAASAKNAELVLEVVNEDKEIKRR